jgi:hypothetical protein
MSAILSTAQITMFNHQDRTTRMPSSRFSMPATCMCMFAAAAAASIIIIGTDVVTSVSLFVWLLLALVTLVVLISLLLTGLTGLIRLESLVGLITERAANKAQGV